MKNKGLLVTMAGIIAVVITAYVAGLIYFGLNNAPLSSVTPWTIIEYGMAHYTITRYQQPLIIAIGGASFLTIIIITFIVALIYRNKEELHGSARFATMRELKKKGLFEGEGILIGKFKGRYLVFTGSQFVFIAAPTRGGKGVSAVIPNLLSWNASSMVLDIKKENFSLTSKYRQKYGQQIFLFNPFAEDCKTHCYNPLFYVRDGLFTIADLTTIANMFYPKLDPKNKFWDDQAANLFLGLALMIKETPELPFTIGELYRQSSGKGKKVQVHLKEIIDARANTANPLSQTCVEALSRFMALSDNSLANTLGSFNAPLVNWANPIFDAATSKNDFDFRELRKQKMTIYICITPDYLPISSLILNLLFSQAINLNVKELPEHNPELKHQCLFVMDEFTSMGAINIIAKSVSFIAGYGLRLLTIVQTKEQVMQDTGDGGYGKSAGKNIISNHAALIAFATKDDEEAESYSKMIGYKTVKSKSRSRKIGRYGGTVSEAPQRRAIMLPQEIKAMGQWKQLINMEHVNPILCDKIRYFDDPIFINRLKEVSPSLNALGKKIPTKAQIDNALLNQELEVPLPLLTFTQDIVEPSANTVKPPIKTTPVTPDIPAETPTQPETTPSLQTEQNLDPDF